MYSHVANMERQVKRKDTSVAIDRETHQWLKQLSKHYDELDLNKVVKKITMQAVRNIGLQKAEVVAR